MDNFSAESKAWERETIEKVLLETIKEQRLRRRWGIVFKSLFAAIIIFIIGYIVISNQGTTAPLGAHTAMVNVQGEIDAASQETNSDIVNESLRAAFDQPQAKGIILKLDSPGGSPVQANEVYDEIRRLRELHPQKKIYAVMGDMCASACYYIASATDYIYANRASLVGSIGVLYDGFGFVDVMKKIGVERRLVTSGINKGFYDPFSPLAPRELGYMQDMLDIIHKQFIDDVKAGRGERLKVNDETFSGLAWTGEQGKTMGLVDGFGSADYVARELIGAAEIVDYSPQMSVIDRLSHRFGSSMADSLASRMGLHAGEVR